MTLLGPSILKVSVTDHGDYWATSSEHFLCTAPRTPFSIQDSGVTHSGVCLHSMGPPPQEKVQLFAGRLATKPWSQDQASLFTSLNLPSLMNRRSYLKLIFAFKVLNDHVFCPFVLFTYHLQPNLRINHNKQLLLPLLELFPFLFVLYIYC